MKKRAYFGLAMNIIPAATGCKVDRMRPDITPSRALTVRGSRAQQF